MLEIRNMLQIDKEMKKTGIFFGSSTGYTADAANRIGRALGVDMADIYDVANTAPSKIGDYDLIILGSSTWGDGDIQDDFADFLDGIEAMDLTGKTVAIFGCGDETMDSFCGAVGKIYRRMQPTGAKFVGEFNADGYDYTGSDAKIDGSFVGLVLDEVNRPELTDSRIAAWVKTL